MTIIMSYLVSGL